MILTEREMGRGKEEGREEGSEEGKEEGREEGKEEEVYHGKRRELIKERYCDIFMN